MRIVSFVLCLLLAKSLYAEQRISGDVSDLESGYFLSGVRIQNVHKATYVRSDSLGRFTFDVSPGELLEFQKEGYQTARVRIPEGHIPPYFRILLRREKQILPVDPDAPRDYHADSLAYYALYKNALEFPELTGLAAIRHPFSAMSKKNRRIWAFQKEYTYFEQQKYIDYTFNEQLVARITGLSGDSLRFYLRSFRPSYQQLRHMSEYDFYRYVKESADFFRTGVRPRVRQQVIRGTQ